ncbi:hypothetical protein EZV62_018852 [Acer yangbiense]|uniref:Reverse transcriptase zinc-binding domain-containing protein n=1 Tax=Acer yangbiense TaxID=1000413 RepID=A0A5C7HBR6_9ROSI|nr:hypothetical protein EZV62_018852 [Acer yangbiense]
MIIPVRCFTCGKVIGNKWDPYLDLLQSDYTEGDALGSSFLPDDADAILSQPISSSRISDSLIWHFDKNGVYTIKSGYKVGKALGCQTSSSCNIGVEWWWKCLWRLRIPVKIRIFIWKAYHTWLSTLVNLAKHGVPTETRCGVCSKKSETTVHALWSCGELKAFRNSCYLFSELNWNNNFQLLDNLCYCSHVLSITEM